MKMAVCEPSGFFSQKPGVNDFCTIVDGLRVVQGVKQNR